MNKRILIMGATSGLGRGVAERFIADGWTVGVAGRNRQALESLQGLAPDRVFTGAIDIMSESAPKEMLELVTRMGGIDIYLHCSGILRADDESMPIADEVLTAETNAVGFTRMVGTAYKYFETSGRKGRLVAISSIAGIRGLESLPAYSASKAYDSTLLEALRQRSRRDGLGLKIVDIKPGWTRTPLLNSGRKYLLEMDAERVIKSVYKATLYARRSVTIGLRWKILTALERLVPAWIYERLHLNLWK
ncbi:MAG: SDR family NAD(P)-dependent oxidoreductase [Muribaculaceae bacterium]|nr:SDR family NAD(P)-dependent oxidoreductase [Muribaculaceae bacterium]